MPKDEVATAEKSDQSELTEDEQKMAKLKEAIDVSIENLGSLRKKLTITVPESIVTERRNDQFSEIKRDSVVPGFRKGHAPLLLVQKRFGHDVNEQLSSQLLTSSYLAAVEKEDLKTIGDPLVWVTKKDADAAESAKLVRVEEAFDFISLPDEGDLTYSCEIEVRPEFELPNLEGVKIKRPTVKIDKKAINEYIDRLRGMRGRYEPITDQKIKEDDLVVCHLRISAEDKVFLEEQNCQLAARPQRYAGILMEDLDKALVGGRIGDKKKFDGAIPDDYEDQSLRGKTAAIELEVVEVKRLVLPEMNDAFFESVGCESKDDLEDQVKFNLESEEKEEIRRQERRQAQQYLMDNCTLELPDRLSQQQADRIAARRMLELARRGIPESEIIKQADAIRSGAQADASMDLHLQFILDKIAEEWDVDVSDDEVNGQIAAIAQRQNRRFDRVRDDLIRNRSIESLYVHVRDEKIIDRIIEQASITSDDASGEKAKTTKETAKKKTTKKAAKKETKKKTTKGKTSQA